MRTARIHGTKLHEDKGGKEMTREHERLLKQMDREADVQNKKENWDAFLEGMSVLVFIVFMAAWYFILGYQY